MNTTSGDEYTQRLVRHQRSTWKRVLDVQAPYRWNLRRLVGKRVTLDVGCGIGRNLVNLAPGSVGVDHNEHSILHCRALGLTAYTPDEFFKGERGKFDALLAAHLVEHMSRYTALAVLRSYLPYLREGSPVVIITPQERGYDSDVTHVWFCGFDEVAGLCAELDLRVRKQKSFPFPRWAGRRFTYNEFVTVASSAV